MAKELTWHGKSEQEVKEMDIKEFMKVIPTRQRRSLKRGFTDAQKALMKLIEADSQNIKTHCRDLVIMPIMLGKMIKVYNGKDFFPVTVTLEMLGHYLGEFSQTRKSVTHSSAGVGATRSSKAVSAR
ncbi:30S ribosomal protein S19 [Candidatus Woesearchaeota archaeon]|jgi:small subunit ribosomal protein S19|nr:30S ribosomal protein S19 [Candidatus Woesearchaeota archaeon]MBT4110366.1 30S ribosomal protein S19 [Candidatus Woesearchaeota archaeon]MBT4336110.1 30S ribosomal protein S19 [Candidatus Woesearchaeota archaeon]MBT4468911.1 30S ribosomal protein S19 [Candidatus Woesearchaeota archaeon]MBT6744770.1 30S ribosomal protein S19 [Candidatus Woesearchaeota archaeon]